MATLNNTRVDEAVSAWSCTATLVVDAGGDYWEVKAADTTLLYTETVLSYNDAVAKDTAQGTGSQFVDEWAGIFLYHIFDALAQHEA